MPVKMPSKMPVKMLLRMFTVLLQFVFVDIGMASYSGRHQDVRRPLVDIIDYIKIFEPGESKDGILRLKWVVVERAIAKGALSFSQHPGKAIWDFARDLSGEDFLALILNDAMKQERRSITDQLQAWEMDLMKMAIFFGSSPIVESDRIWRLQFLHKLQFPHLILNESSRVTSEILWYYFSLEGQAEDSRNEMKFKNTGAIGNDIFSGGSVLLVWPSFIYSTLFPRNFFGRSMPRDDTAFTKLDRMFKGIGDILDEFKVDQRERMNIYELFRKIRQNPALILSPDFAESVARRENGIGTLSLLYEANQVASARQGLLVSRFIREELGRRPAIQRMNEELSGAIDSEHRSVPWLCPGFLRRFLLRDR